MPAAKATAATAIHFVTGSDEAGVKKTAVGLATRLAPSDDPFAVETIDGAAATVDEACQRIGATIEALLTIPFFGGGKLVWLKNASFLADSVTGRSESVTDAVERLLKILEAGLAEGVVFLLSAPDADKRRSAFKTLKKIAESHVEDKPDFGWGATEADVIDWVARQAAAAKLTISSDALEVLAARVGAESRQLDTEILKLQTAFGPDHEVTEDDVRALVPATRAGGIFDLSNALAKRDLALCLDTLDQLFRQGERAVGLLLAAIVPTVRNLLLVKDLMERHRITPPAQPQFFAGSLKKLSDEATAHLPRKKDGTLSAYPLGIAAVNARRFSLDELSAAFRACADANRQLITSQLAEDVVLERLVVQITGKPALESDAR